MSKQFFSKPYTRQFDMTMLRVAGVFLAVAWLLPEVKSEYQALFSRNAREESRTKLLKSVYHQISQEVPISCVNVISSKGKTHIENTDGPTSYYELDAYRNFLKPGVTSRCVHVFDLTSSKEVRKLLEDHENLLVKMKKFVFVVSTTLNKFEDDGPEILTAHFFRKVFDAVEYREYRPGKYVSFTKTLQGVAKFNNWNGTRLLFKRPLFPDKLSNFNGKIFRACTFDYAISTYQDENGEFQGYETKIVKEIGKSLNFTLSISRPPNGELWGEFKNGEYTGMIGQVQKEFADIGWAAIFIIFERTQYVDYTDYIFADNMCFMMPVPPSPPLWMSIAAPLDLPTWLLLVATVVTSSFFVYCFSIIKMKSGDKAYSLQLITTYLLASLFDQTSELVVTLKSYRLRLFYILWLMGTVVLKTGYRGGLMSVLTIPPAPNIIDTVKELAEQPTPVSSFSDPFYLLANQSLDPSVKKIAQNYIVHYDFDEAIRNLSESRVVMGEAKEYLDFIQREMFTDKNGVSNMHIMKECLYQFSTAFLTTNDSPYSTRISEKLAQLKESGLVSFWIRKEKDKISTLIKDGNLNEGPKPLKIENYQAPMMIYGMMMMFAIASFVYELIAGKDKKTPGNRTSGDNSRNSLRLTEIKFMS